MVLLTDEAYDSMRDRVLVCDWRLVYRESDKRMVLREMVTEQLTGEHASKIKMHITTPSSVHGALYENDGRGPYGRAMLSGRRLHPRERECWKDAFFRKYFPERFLMGLAKSG